MDSFFSINSRDFIHIHVIITVMRFLKECDESNTMSSEVFVKDQVSDWHWARDADGGASQEIVVMAIVVVMV